MSQIDLAISRTLLKQAHMLVKKHFPRINIKLDAWTYCSGANWTFHHGNFIWEGDADNAYDCRYKGWMAWLKHKGIEI
jgi:hypothetical protein